MAISKCWMMGAFGHSRDSAFSPVRSVLESDLTEFAQVTTSLEVVTCVYVDQEIYLSHFSCNDNISSCTFKSVLEFSSIESTRTVKTINVNAAPSTVSTDRPRQRPPAG
jgi:hypothetical protein